MSVTDADATMRSVCRCEQNILILLEVVLPQEGWEKWRSIMCSSLIVMVDVGMWEIRSVFWCELCVALVS